MSVDHYGLLGAAKPVCDVVCALRDPVFLLTACSYEEKWGFCVGCARSHQRTLFSTDSFNGFQEGLQLSMSEGIRAS